MLQSILNKTIRIFLLLCLAHLSMSFNIGLSISPSPKMKFVSLSVVNKTIGEIFKNIQDQTGLTFFYNNDIINTKDKRTIKVHNIPLDQVLSILLDNKNLNWKIDETGGLILITPKSQNGLTPSAPIEDTSKEMSVSGDILDKDGKAVIGASVLVKGTNIRSQTDENGRFFISAVLKGKTIQVTSIGYAPQEYTINNQQFIHIILNLSSQSLHEVEVVSTGYQKLPKERATGSFDFVDNTLLNRRVSTDILSRIDGVTSGVIFNKQDNKIGGDPSTGGDPDISIRGRSTLFSNTSPLIVLDNFPYDGDPTNINPNDIESITILKDAAAASIWGVRAANGVIVLTSKKGRYNQQPVINFNTNLTVAEKPNVYSVPQLSSKDYVDVEKYLFNNGEYDVFLDYVPYYVQSPVVDILDKEKNGIISHDNAAAALSAISSYDNRSDYSRYFLRNAINQQYSISIAGGSQNDQYYVSGGFDRNLDAKVPNSYNRYTVNARNMYKLFQQKLEFSTDILFTKSVSKSNPNTYLPVYPYEKFVDDKGNALSIIRDFRQASKDALTNNNFLDWNYYPLNERNYKGVTNDLTGYRINLGINYKIYRDILSLSIHYQYEQGNINQSILKDLSTYSTRLLINQFTELPSSGVITYPVPLGAVLTQSITNSKNNTGRAQLSYRQIFSGGKHEINAIGGVEIKDNNTFQMSNILYGYNQDNATSVPVDYFTDFPKQIGGTGRITNYYGQQGSIDRFFSYYLNASYVFRSKYTFSISGRRDESNLFGVDAEMKGIPLYSLGGSWEISKEKFYQVSFLPYLRMRLTDGYNGNLNKSLSAYTTSAVIGLNSYNSTQQQIVNPPNPMLRWEKVNVVNAAVDFSSAQSRISGSVEYYIKNAKDLIGKSPLAPQVGIVQFTGNTANMKTKGLDLTLNTINIRGSFQWTSNFLLSFVKDKITDYKYQVGVNSYYVQQNYSNPIVGKPHSAIFSYPWAGLDSAGNPQGILNGKVSEDYSGITNSTNINNLVYKGTSAPTFFGGLRNNFNYHNFDLSFNITYKLGYYFRRGSYTLSAGTYQQADYDKRWQKPGDEFKTIVPSLIYPYNVQRDIFYTYSEALIENASHIRLQDVQIGYTFMKKHDKTFFKTLRIYAYVNNLGILWRANHLRLDPDVVGGGYYDIPSPKAYSVGINLNL
ncbi:SusC/RagA family TonB-linked outer membrane protein [Chitinophaga sp. 30R24]|uniref:SusC/RagA family TonB-linked outer membrane protein n=1 Tax=Chitinophaga sp. 30R24 TaxID=3248838 RepID=UPI003B918166